MCNQAYSSNKKRCIRYFKFFASDKNAKIALFAQVPHMGLVHPSTMKARRSYGPTKSIGLS